MKRQHNFTLIVIMLIALALRLYRIGYREFSFDELGQIVVAQAGWWDAIFGAAKHAGAAPLDYLITHIMLAAGSGEAFLRLPAAVWGVVAVGLVYLLARQCVGAWPALLIAFVLAITPQAIRYSQELRFYSLATMMALLCVWLFWRATQRGAWQGWAWLGVAFTVGFYAHYYIAFVAASCGLWALLYRRDLFWRVVLVAGVAGLLFAPWVYYDNFVYAQTVFHPRALPGWQQLAYAPLANGDALNWALWALVALAVVTMRRQRPIVALFALVGLGTFAGAVALDTIGGYPFYQRQALVALPFLLLAGLGGLLGLLPRWRAVLAAVVVAGCLVAFVPDLRAFYPDHYPNNGLAATGTFLSHYVRANDAVLVGGDPLRFMLYAPDLQAQTPGIAWRRFDEHMEERAAKYDRLFLVIWNFEPAARLEAWAKAHGAQDITPWARGETRIYVYSASDPNAGQAIIADARAR